MYKKRELEAKLADSMKNRKISILLGARQTGKTTILKRIQETVPLPKLFVDLDIFENRRIFSSYTEIINYLKFNQYRENQKFTLFLDEFHTVKGIGKLLKNIYDNHPDIKIFATGSSSLETVKHLI